MTEQAEADLRYMPIIVRDGDISEWERKFCASMIRQDRRAAFTPSDKQAATMRRIVQAFQERALREPHGDFQDSGEVIE